MATYRIYFSGQVQGVGFRATCCRLAEDLPGLAGEVCNLGDGRVRLTVRGEARDVADLVGRLREAFRGYVDDVEQAELPAGDDPLPPGLSSGVRVTRGR